MARKRCPTCDMRTLSGRLRLGRYASGLEFKQLGYRTGYSGETVKEWERGHRSIPASALGTLAQAFRTTAEWLLTGEGEPPEGYRRFHRIEMDGRHVMVQF